MYIPGSVQPKTVYIFLITLGINKTMSDIFVNFNTPNPGQVIADAIRGQSYRKVTMIELSSRSYKHCTILEHAGDRLIITYRNSISCDVVEVEIGTLVVEDIRQLMIIPRFLVEYARYVIIKNLGVSPTPPIIIGKLKQKYYREDTKYDMVPDSTYIAKKVSDFDDVDLRNISKLILRATCEDLVDMVTFIKFNQDISLRQITILCQGLTNNRSELPFFDLSTLADIKANKISLNTYKYTGFKKFVSLTTIPHIHWITSSYAINHGNIVDDITNELAGEEDADMENNYTLLKFIAIRPYQSIYKNLFGIAQRNKKIHDNMRFTRTKAAS